MQLKPLCAVALVLLCEKPMHPYEMFQTLRTRGDDRLVKVRPGSLYRSVERLVEDSSVPLTDPEALEVVVARGKTIPDAVESVDWAPTALLMAGSSKLAQRGELFLSSTTAKILTRLPIPVLVVPRDYHPGRYGSEAQPWTGSLRVVDPAPPRRGNRP